MKTSMKPLGALIFGIAVGATLAVPAQAVDTAPSVEELKQALFLPAVPAERPVEPGDGEPSAPAPSLDPPEATPQSLSSGSFYICFDDTSGFFCGGCPLGTHCATEACGSPFAACCTLSFSCVTSCQVSPGCRSICASCVDF